MSAAEGFDEWAIVELFGHQRIAGRVSEAQIGGCNFVRIDVPAVGDERAYTRYLGNGAIYAINPTDEHTARAAAAAWRVVPISAYEIPGLANLRNQNGLEFDEHHDDVDAAADIGF